MVTPITCCVCDSCQGTLKVIIFFIKENYQFEGLSLTIKFKDSPLISKLNTKTITLNSSSSFSMIFFILFKIESAI